MAISNLETIIDDIEQLIETVRPDSKGKIMLPKAELKQLLDELRNSIPSEIKRFSEKTRALEQTKQQAIEEARNNAERIVNEANAMRDRLLDENEQVKMAEEKANQILQQANLEAIEIKNSNEQNISAIHDKAIKEYDDSLVYMINYIQNLGKQTTDLLNNNIGILREKLNEIIAQRNSLHESIQRNRDIQNQQRQMYNNQYNNPNMMNDNWR